VERTANSPTSALRSLLDLHAEGGGVSPLHVLYCTKLYCTTMTPRAARMCRHCTVLYCTALYCSVLYCTVQCCTVLYCPVLNLLYVTLLY